MPPKATCHCGYRYDLSEVQHTRFPQCPACGSSVIATGASAGHAVSRGEFMPQFVERHQAGAGTNTGTRPRATRATNGEGANGPTARKGSKRKRIEDQCRVIWAAKRRKIDAAARSLAVGTGTFWCWLKPRARGAAGFAAAELQRLFSRATLRSMRDFAASARQSPASAIVSTLGNRRVQGWLSVLVVGLFAMIIARARLQDASTLVSPAVAAGQPATGPSFVVGGAGPGEANAAAAESKAKSIVDYALPIAFRNYRDEWICAYEMVTGEKWSRTPFGPSEYELDVPTPGVNDPLARAIGVEEMHVVGLDFTGVSLTDERLQRVKSLPYLKRLWLAGANLDNITEKGLAALSGCERLEVVDLHEQAVSDECLTYIGKCPALTALNLRKTRVTNSGMRRLENPLLRELDISGTKVSEVGLVDITRLTKLEKLWFKECPVKDWSYLSHFRALGHLSDFGMVLPVEWKPAAGRSTIGEGVIEGWSLAWVSYRGSKQPKGPPVAEHDTPNTVPQIEGVQILTAIQDMTQLREVDLCFAKCRDEDLKLLAKLENLTVLDLSFSDISKAGLAHLAPLKKLKYLNLSSTPVHFEDLQALKAVPSLTDVGVNETDLSREEVQKLEQEELPRVKLWSERLRRQ